MRLRHRWPLAVAAIVFVMLAVGVATEQAGVKPSSVDGQVRSELSLGGYTVAVAYAPALSANDPAHRDVLSGSGGSAAARVRVARLETTGTLRVGDVAAGKRDPKGISYDLWLEATNGGWQLQLVDVANAAANQATIVGRVPLNVGPPNVGPTFRSGVPVRSGVPAPELKLGPTDDFVGALVPETGNSGRLVLRWGNHEAATDFVFVDPPQLRRTAETIPPNTTVSRAHDEDTSALSRARLLAQRNETALVLSNGQRLSVSFQRTFGKGERAAAGGGVRTRGLPADGPDFARLATLSDGAVVMLTQSAVPRLTIEAPLGFGQTVIRPGNQVPGFPGAYGIWLKRRAGGAWRLVFNHEPDAWGSQHDPKFDAAEIELRHSEGAASSRPFAVGLVPTAADRGRLLIVWGPHEWSAEFVVGQ